MRGSHASILLCARILWFVYIGHSVNLPRPSRANAEVDFSPIKTHALPFDKLAMSSIAVGGIWEDQNKS